MGQYYKKVLTKKISPIISKFGIGSITRNFYSGKGQILMFHRVLPINNKQRIHNHLSLEISPEHLESIILFYKKEKYDFISLSNLIDWLQENETNDRKFVAFTFDDGYKDNLEYAYPIFAKYKVSFTLYVTTSFPERNAIFWWYLLEDLVLKENTIICNFSQKQERFILDTYRRKEMAFSIIREKIMNLNNSNLESELTDFFGFYGYDLYTYNDKITLSWLEVSEMANDECVEIGAHTINHYNLTSLSDKQAKLEILESKQLIELKTKSEVKHFSYPLGKFRQREIDYVEQSGFQTATTTKTANIFPLNIYNPYTLPRISVNSLTSQKVLKLHMDGFFHALLNKFKRVVY
jgi:peptidoglycan/xylan/chitin deacetylase (PgdA/CDA1 family)